MGKDIYQSAAQSYQDVFANDHVVLAFIDRVLNYLPPQSHILDVGCGTGKPVGVRLAAAGHQLNGIDVSPTMIDHIRQNVPNGQFQIADMTDYEYPNGEPLDAVFNVRALFRNSRADIEMCVAKWAKWLQSGGLLCMVVFTADDYNPAKIKQYDEDGLCASVERRFMGWVKNFVVFSRAGWKRLLQENGLELLHENMDVFVPPGDLSDEAAQYCLIARKL